MTPQPPGDASRVFAWFREKYGEPTPAQREAWPRIARGENVLIASPTGTGKTFAAFLAVLDALACENEHGGLGAGIACVYVSPLRALGYDLEKNLTVPLRELFGEKPPIRVELRSGDTAASQRAKQLAKPPHILLTTPESLCLLLTQEKWLPHLARVRWLIIDEIHALAGNKRGAHLALSVERLAALTSSEGLAAPTSRHRERSEARAARVARPMPPPSAVEGPSVSSAGAMAESMHSVIPGSAAPPSAEARGPSTPLRSAQDDGRMRALQRIGLSATVAPLSDVARYLCGVEPCEVIDVSTEKKVELSVYTPLRKDPYPSAGFTGQRLVGELGELIKKNRTTLVFTNTRSGAEGTTFWLRENFPELANEIECHHASLERDVRRDVEDRLKRGELRAVICSTSLELGIDIGSVDLVVMLATPKGVSRALQRAGRAGHNIHSVSRGMLMATNVGDLVEACATVLLARTRKLDPIIIPDRPLDVLAQHLVSMGCTDRWSRADALALVRRAWPYRELSAEELGDVLDYLAGGGKSLRQAYSELFGKIALDDEGFETREGRVRRDFMQNIGTIPDTASVRVRLKTQKLGSVEESFMRQLKIGDVFIVAGRAVRLEKVAQMDAWVSRADGETPTVPRWNAAKMPLSNRVCEEIIAFRSELRFLLDDPERASREAAPFIAQWIAKRLDCGKANAELIRRMHAAQHRLSEIPTADFLLIEEHLEREQDHLPESAPARARKSDRILARHYFFHSLIGRSANDALARVMSFRLNKLRGGNALATPHDYGFVLTVTPAQEIMEGDLPELLKPGNVEAELDAALNQSEMLKYHFRNAAQTGLMVYRNYFDERKPVRKVQWSAEVIFNVLQQYEPDHVLLREARREVLHTFVDAEGAARFLDHQRHRPVRLRRVPRVPPLAFAMYATKMREAMIVEDPYETMERLYNQWWSEIEGAEK
jgi:ATP-dependent helicase Lhr and Lhr-like helicase